MAIIVVFDELDLVITDFQMPTPGEQAASIVHISRWRVQQLAMERKLGIRIGRTLVLTVKEALYLHRRPKPGGDRRSVTYEVCRYEKSVSNTQYFLTPTPEPR